MCYNYYGDYMNGKDNQYMDMLVHTIGVDRIDFLERINPDIIDANGRYMMFDRDGGLLSLSYLKNECEIEFLRILHQDESIASNILINRNALFRELDSYYNPNLVEETFEIAERVPQGMTKLKLDKSQKYNSGFELRDFIPKNWVAIAVAAGMTISIFAGGYTMLRGNKKETYEPYLETNNYAIFVEEPIAVITEAELSQGETFEDNTHLREEYIKEACNIYQLDYELVYKFLVELTENFSSLDFLEGRLPNLSCKGMEVKAKSEYELYIYACRILKQDPGRWSINTDGLYINNGYTSGTDYCTLIEKVAEVIGVDKHLMYAIVQTETGFKSDLFLEGNNPAGLKNNQGDFWYFDNLEEGLYEFAMEIKKYYLWIGEPTTDLSTETISRIGEIHAPVSDNNQNWLPNVLQILEEARNNSEELFGTNVQNNGLSH